MKQVHDTGVDGSSSSQRHQISFHAAQREIYAELDMPEHPSGLAVISWPKNDERSGVLLREWMRSQAMARGIATLTLDPAQGSLRDEAERLTNSIGWLRKEIAIEHPIHMLVGGRSFAAAMRCKPTNIASIVAWNARPGLLWKKPVRVPPTLLMLGPNVPRRMALTNRLAYWRLGRHAHLLRAAGNSAAAERIGNWMQQPLPLRVVSPRLDRRVRRQIAGSAAALALALPLTLQPGAIGAAAPQPTHSRLLHADPFADGVTLTASNIRGDGLAVPHRAPGKKHGHGARRLGPQDIQGDGVTPGRLSTGSQPLIDGIGLKWFVNTNITFSTTSSASGAASEASFTQAVAASTLNGGTVASTLNDAFDGYNSLCLSANGTVANCATGNENFTIYNKNGLATLPATCSDREIVFPVQTMGTFEVSRRVYVPSNDSFARWLNIVKNTGATAQSVTMVIANNLGSDSNTRIVTSSNGNATPEVSDTWITSFQNWSGTTSSDVRLGHVFQGTGVSALSGVNFVNGDDNPFWGYTITLQPGETGIIMNLTTGQATQAAAAAKAAELAAGPAKIFACMTPTEQSQVRNFIGTTNLSVVVSDGTDPVKVGQPLSYTVDVSNTGPASATNVVVTATLPTGATYVGASGTGWTFSQAGGVVTATRASLAVGAAPSITIDTTAPTTAGSKTISVSVSNDTPDSDSANNTASASTTVDLYKQALALVAVRGYADLAVTNIALSPTKTSFSAGEPAQISVTITNQGIATAEPFWVDLYFNPSSSPTVNQTWNSLCGLTPCYGIAWGVTQSLAPGQSITLTSTVGSYAAGQTNWPGYFASGTNQIVVQADSFNPASTNGAVEESNETNNTASLTLSVTGTNPASIQSADGQPELQPRPASPVR